VSTVYRVVAAPNKRKHAHLSIIIAAASSAATQLNSTLSHPIPERRGETAELAVLWFSYY